MSSALLSAVFLGIGLAVGFLAQRSRMCFVAGLRDWILVRDGELITGLFSFLATVWVLTSLFAALGLLHHGVPEYGTPASLRFGPGDLASGTPPAVSALAFVRLGDASHVQLSSLLNNFFLATLAGGFLIGVLSVIAGGCVLRQHVLCVQGDRNALFYLAGFYCAVVVYYALLSRFFDWAYK